MNWYVPKLTEHQKTYLDNFASIVPIGQYLYFWQDFTHFFNNINPKQKYVKRFCDSRGINYKNFSELRRLIHRCCQIINVYMRIDIKIGNFNFGIAFEIVYDILEFIFGNNKYVKSKNGNDYLKKKSDDRTFYPINTGLNYGIKIDPILPMKKIFSIITSLLKRRIILWMPIIEDDETMDTIIDKLKDEYKLVELRFTGEYNEDFENIDEREYEIIQEELENDGLEPIEEGDENDEDENSVNTKKSNAEFVDENNITNNEDKDIDVEKVK